MGQETPPVGWVGEIGPEAPPWWLIWADFLLSAPGGPFERFDLVGPLLTDLLQCYKQLFFCVQRLRMAEFVVVRSAKKQQAFPGGKKGQLSLSKLKKVE